MCLGPACTVTGVGWGLNITGSMHFAIRTSRTCLDLDLLSILMSGRQFVAKLHITRLTFSELPPRANCQKSPRAWVVNQILQGMI